MNRQACIAKMVTNLPLTSLKLQAICNCTVAHQALAAVHRHQVQVTAPNP